MNCAVEEARKGFQRPVQSESSLMTCEVELICWVNLIDYPILSHIDASEMSYPLKIDEAAALPDSNLQLRESKIANRLWTQ